MSYRKKHIKNKIHKIKPKKSIFKRLWFWLAILFLVIILSSFYLVLFYQGIWVSNIIISGNNKITSRELDDIVSANINTGLVKFWNFDITSKSIFLVNIEKLNKQILEKFPTIEKASASKKFPQTIMLGVTERKPVGAYCNSASECFLFDQNGVAFEPLHLPIDDFIIVRQAAENGQMFVGEQVVAQNIVSAISKIKENLRENFQIDLTEAMLTSPIRMNITTKENWRIYFDLDIDSDINSQLTKLTILLKEEISPESKMNLRYIDLRPKDRAIICDNIICGG